MEARGQFVCGGCERKALEAQGYDLTAGHFAWVCRTCSRSFDDEHTARRHGSACSKAKLAAAPPPPPPAPPSRPVGRAAARQESAVALQHSLLEQLLPAADEESGEGIGTLENGRVFVAGSGLGAAAGRALCGRRVHEGRGAWPHGLPLPLPPSHPASPPHVPPHVPAPRPHPAAPTPTGHHDVHRPARLQGAARRRRRYVVRPPPHTPHPTPRTTPRPSPRSLRHHFRYVLRLPNSGGCNIDGKEIADAIRSNAANPAADGRWYPADGDSHWRVGAASMANDPQAMSMYNSHIVFCKPRGANRWARAPPPPPPPTHRRPHPHHRRHPHA